MMISGLSMSFLLFPDGGAKKLIRSGILTQGS